MGYSVQSYRLPREASRLDRWTLAAWKRWDGWVGPGLATAALMWVAHVIAVHQVVGLFGGPTPGGWFLPGWGPVTWTIDLASGTAIPVEPMLPTFAWAIRGEFAGAVAGALTSLLVLRRHRHPILLGMGVGLAIVAFHVTRAHLWTLEPFGGASGSYQIAGVMALWSLPLLTALLGWLIPRRRVPGGGGPLVPGTEPTGR